MTAFVVHDWRFAPEGDAGAAMAVASTYVEELMENGRAEASLWTRSWQEPLRHFHVPVFRDLAGLEAANVADETKRFVEGFYPHVSDEGVVHVTCETVLSSGGELQAVPLGGPGHTLVVNDFTFSGSDDARGSLEAAERYVQALRQRPEVVLSLWGRDVERPRRHFHVIAFREAPAAAAARRWPETEAFAQALFPHLDVHTVEQPFTDVVLSSAGRLPAESLGEGPRPA